MNIRPILNIAANFMRVLFEINQLFFVYLFQMIGVSILYLLKILLDITRVSSLLPTKEDLLFKIENNRLIEFLGIFDSHISIPDSVIEIGSHALGNKRNLISVSISHRTTHINELSFAGCRRLTIVEIPENMSFISTWAFRKCTSLLFFICDNPVKARQILQDVNLLCSPKVQILSHKEYMDQKYHLAAYNLTQEEAKRLYHLTLKVQSGQICKKDIANVFPHRQPDEIKIIMSCVDNFNVDCLDSSTKKYNVLNTLRAYFLYLSSRTSAFIDSVFLTIVPKENYDLKNNYDFKIDDGELIRYCGVKDNVTIPDTVLEIKSNAFSSCPNLKIVEFPSTLMYFERFSFNECPSLSFIICDKPEHLRLSSCTSRLQHVQIVSHKEYMDQEYHLSAYNLTQEEAKGLYNIIKKIQSKEEICRNDITLALPERNVHEMKEIMVRMGCATALQKLNFVVQVNVNNKRIERLEEILKNELTLTQLSIFRNARRGPTFCLSPKTNDFLLGEAFGSRFLNNATE